MGKKKKGGGCKGNKKDKKQKLSEGSGIKQQTQ